MTRGRQLRREMWVLEPHPTPPTSTPAFRGTKRQRDGRDGGNYARLHPAGPLKTAAHHPPPKKGRKRQKKNKRSTCQITSRLRHDCSEIISGLEIFSVDGGSTLLHSQRNFDCLLHETLCSCHPQSLKLSRWFAFAKPRLVRSLILHYVVRILAQFRRGKLYAASYSNL